MNYPGASGTWCLGGIDGMNVTGQYNASGYHGFLYNGTTWISLGYPGATDTRAWGIDGANIIGHYYDILGRSHGFLYDGTIWTPLDYPGAQHTLAYGVDGGNIVGTFSDGTGEHGYPYTTIPAPGTLLLATFGAGLVRWLRRHKTL